MQADQIIILGVGNILFTDEGFGIRVIERLKALYTFPDHVSIVDGGVLGINLMGVIATADILLVVDAMMNHESPGTFYRIAGDEIPQRIRAKNSLHQIDLLEALTLCQVLDNVPETVILGVEPVDIRSMSTELTPLIQTKIDPMIQIVLKELDQIDIHLYQRKTSFVPGNTI